MTTIPNNLAVFLWTFQRKWKGLVVFLVSVAVLVFVMVSFYPTIVELRGELMAEASGGEIPILLTQDDAKSGDYTLEWDVYAGADGYVVVTSDTEIPLPLVKSMAPAQANLHLMAALLPGSGKHSLEILDATTTSAKLTGLDAQYGEANAVVYFGVLAFQGGATKATILAASQMVNTHNMVSDGAFDKLMEKPFVQAFTGGKSVDIFSIKGYLDMRLFSSLPLFIILYFVIQYAREFSWEVEHKTLDLILSTPLSRRGFFVSRYLSWVALDVVLVLGLILFITLSLLTIGERIDMLFGDITRTMLSFLPFLLCVQSFGMLVSVSVNDSGWANGIVLGDYFGMYFLHVVAILSEGWGLLKYASIFHYWDHNAIFEDGIIPWGNPSLLLLVAVGLFAVGMDVFEGKDLPM